MAGSAGAHCVDGLRGWVIVGRRPAALPASFGCSQCRDQDNICLFFHYTNLKEIQCPGFEIVGWPVAPGTRNTISCVNWGILGAHRKYLNDISISFNLLIFVILGDLTLGSPRTCCQIHTVYLKSHGCNFERPVWCCWSQGQCASSKDVRQNAGPCSCLCYCNCMKTIWKVV